MTQPATWRPVSGSRSERPVAPVDALVDALVWISGQPRETPARAESLPVRSRARDPNWCVPEDLYKPWRYC